MQQKTSTFSLKRDFLSLIFAYLKQILKLLHMYIVYQRNKLFMGKYLFSYLYFIFNIWSREKNLDDKNEWEKFKKRWFKVTHLIVRRVPKDAMIICSLYKQFAALFRARRPIHSINSSFWINSASNKKKKCQVIKKKSSFYYNEII